MADFYWAIKQMKEGNKVFSKEHSDWLYFIKNGNLCFVTKNKNNIRETGKDSMYNNWYWENTDWDIFEEDESLSSKISDCDLYSCHPNKIEFKEVKKAIQKLQYNSSSFLFSLPGIDNFNKLGEEIFGDKLWN